MGRRSIDEAADAELFGALAPGLRRFAAVVRPPGMDPDDLVQEAVARTLSVRSLTSLDDPSAYLRTAMVRIASNASRSLRRARAREARVSVPDEHKDRYPSDVAELMRAPARARAVLYLTIVDGLSYRDASVIVGCSEEAARAMASRALKKLRTEVESEVPG